MTIDRFSYASLHLELLFDDTQLGYATGFVVLHKNLSYLITNWHVVTGRHPQTNAPISKTAGIPNYLNVWFHRKHPDLHIWIQHKINLFDKNGDKTWKEHPKRNDVDVIAIPLINLGGLIVLHTFELSLADTQIYLSPSEPVSIIGFPLGQTSYGRFPIWKTGHIASDIDLDYDEKPAFLIDATTKEGMSGSPVFAKRIGLITIAPGTHTMGGERIKFLGVYSNRTTNISDVGVVWKPKVIEEILNQ